MAVTATIKRAARRHLPEKVIVGFLGLIDRGSALFVRVSCLAARFTDRFRTRLSDAPALPPPELRFRVSGSPSASLYDRVGRRASQDIETCLGEAGFRMADFKSVLDFGCGCGRTLAWLMQQHPEKCWYGCDIHRESIEWCRRHLPTATVTNNEPLPPLTYGTAEFDLVFCISVFTHLPEERQSLWLAEMERILKPSGVLLITVYGATVCGRLDPRDQKEVEGKGIVSRPSSRLRSFFPSWYQTTFHDPGYVEGLLAQRFASAVRVAGGFGDLDAWVACKRPHSVSENHQATG